MNRPRTRTADAAPRRAPLTLVAALLLAWPPACGPDTAGAPEPAEPFTRVLVVGIDGLEWSVLHPLVAQGRCPNLAGLMRRGVFGNLGTMVPTWSPVVWTSIATGKSMQQHGIRGFVDNTGQVYTSGRRRGRALWDIADRHGLSSAVIGWWTTWPVTDIDGVMISGTNAPAQLDVNWKPALMPGLDHQVHPPELAPRVYDIAGEAGDREAVLERARRIFATSVADLPPPERKLVDESLWSIQADATYAALATELLDDAPYDLSLVYLGGPDVVGHRFWRQLHPEQFAWSGSSPELDARLACTVPRYYEWADELVGEIVAAAGDDVAVLVVSDHGMHADPLTVAEPAPHGGSGNHQDGAPGVVIAAGPGMRRVEGEFERFVERGPGALATRGSIYDVAPTVLGLLGIPPARDMQSRPQRKWLSADAREFVSALEPVDTHDRGFREPSLVLAPTEANAAFSERMLDQLGYTGGASEAPATLVNPDDFDPVEGASACR